MTRLKLTSQQVIDFASYMFDYHNLKPKDKRKSWIMKIAAWFLDKRGYMTKENFMKYYTTVILGRVYLPFTIGNEEERWLPSQVGTITHECQHAVQKRENKKYNWEYATNTSKRAMYEAEAYRASMELHFWSTGKILSPLTLSNKLFNYGCKTLDVSMAKIALERAITLVGSGVVMTEATKTALIHIGNHLTEHKGKGELLPKEYYTNKLALK